MNLLQMKMTVDMLRYYHGGFVLFDKLLSELSQLHEQSYSIDQKCIFVVSYNRTIQLAAMKTAMVNAY